MRAFSERPSPSHRLVLPMKGGDKHVSEWAIHFVSARDPADRFYFEEQPTRLPGDGALSPDADAFEVLTVQLGRGGLIPGFPDAFLRRAYEPDPGLLFESLDKVSLGARVAAGGSIVGVALLKSELEEAGAVHNVHPEHEEVFFEDLLCWRDGFDFDNMVSLKDGFGMLDEVPFLPIFLESRLKFTNAAIFVEDVHRAVALQGLMTSMYFARLHDHVSTSRLERTAIIWPEPESRCSAILDLDGFASIEAIVPTDVDDRIEKVVDEAFRDAVRAAEDFVTTSESCGDAGAYTHFLLFNEISNPVAQHLVRSEMAGLFDDEAIPFSFCLELRPNWRGSYSAERSMSDRMAAVLTQKLGLPIFVHAVPE